MEKENDQEELLGLLRKARRVIGYLPLGTEPDFNSFLSVHAINASLTVVPQQQNADPEVFAHDFAEGMSSDVCVFVPGTAFDSNGTRHGRGGGWYDRFFSIAPPTWIRIGVLDVSAFSKTSLVREAWDEPVDYLLISESGTWKVLATHVREY